MLYSLIIPVFNRPDHIKKLLECFTRQTFKNFEVIVVESGSAIKSDKVVESYHDKINIKYIAGSNKGQGFSRNKGLEEAKGDYLIILDSDILMPDNYMDIVDKHLKDNHLDAYGGPDKLHPESSLFQTAVNFCMTSLLTTGGARGRAQSIGKYYPRSFNMGLSRAVYEKIGGFNIPFMGEDIEFSSRIIANGFKTGLIEDAYIYHERKNSLKGFYNQLFFFGRARINITKLIPGSLKPTHFLPLAYTLYVLSILIIFLVSIKWGYLWVIPLLIYNFLIMISAGFSQRSLSVALYSVLLVNALMLSYSLGMIKEFFKLNVLKKEQTYKL